MPNTDIWRDIPASIGLLSRIPTGIDPAFSQKRGAKMTWAFPIAGVFLGLLAYVFVGISAALNVPNLIAAILSVALVIFITGALHEDGLADTFDGLWGGWTREGRLEIMKDSHIGTYGVCALACAITLKISLYYIILQESSALALIGLFCLSRGAMVPVMALLPNARTDGFSQAVGRPSKAAAWVAVALAVIGGLLFANFGALIGCCIGAAAIALIAQRKIGGQTGDILGAVQQISELTAALGFIIILYN